ncbi:MAG: hypothetical protein DHS20C09_11280 [marine bacterium B5-7]|nr:MAG: hypothetical protein DHS20C09_11280 [marine bacterium B5-7]
MNLTHMLEKKLAEAFTAPWDLKRPTRYEILYQGEKVGLGLFVKKPNGHWHLIYQEPFILLESEDDLDDFLARALSNFLMKHPEWLR